MAQLIMITLSLTVLSLCYLAQDVFPVVYIVDKPLFAKFGPCVKTYQNIWASLFCIKTFYYVTAFQLSPLRKFPSFFITVCSFSYLKHF